MPGTNILILGIDGANPDLLLRWSADGTLPNVGRLLQKGQSGKMDGLKGFFIGSTWPSIYTGLSPARHGFHYLIQLERGSYDFYRPADRGLFDGTPFWSALSKSGCRVAVMDAPLSPLDPSINGMQILEWGGHDAVYGLSAQPPALVETIQSHFGAHPAGINCDGLRCNAEDYRGFVERLESGIKTRAHMTKHFLQESEWDLFMQVFSEAHCAGHQCWHLHDRTHPAHDPSIVAEIGDPIRRVYQAIDKAIGEILDEAGECTTFVFSSHGMSHWYGAHFLLQEILVQLGVTHPKEQSKQPTTAASLAESTGRWAWHQLPQSVRSRLAGIRKLYRKGTVSYSADLPSVDADPRRSKCFHHRNGLAVGGIRLNIAGREPQGILESGREADKFCQTLSADLLEIVDDRTGQPLIRRVIRVADHYEGLHLEDLPDLLVEYNESIPVGSTRLANGRDATVRARSPKIGIIEGANSYGRTGEHRSEGLLIATGPDIRPGTIERPISVLDLAPTWSQSLGVNMQHTDGTPIEELIQPHRR
jgi:predicted AlkP superfamily phosphohydrolase/phosphomutase